jgi:hypothetical protein
MTASFSEGVGFAVDGGVVLLDSAIMAAAEQLTIGVEDCGADRDATFGEPGAGLGEGHLEHFVAGHSYIKDK